MCCTLLFMHQEIKIFHLHYNTHLLWFLPASFRYFSNRTQCGTKITVQTTSLAVLPSVLEILVVLEDLEVQLARCLLGVRGDPSVLDGLYDQVFQDHLEALFLLEGLFHLWCQALPRWKKKKKIISYRHKIRGKLLISKHSKTQTAELAKLLNTTSGELQMILKLLLTEND